MNPLTNVKMITKLNEREISMGINEKSSWHNEYKDSAWIFVGGLDYGLTEGDIICVFSQYGEIANINFLRDKKTGKPKGYCFVCYEDQRSTVLAVDNFNGIKMCNRTIRVDHVANYRPPKDDQDLDEITKKIREEGCLPRIPEIEHLKTEKVKGKIPNDQKANTVVKTEKQDPGYEKHDVNLQREPADDGRAKRRDRRSRSNSRERTRPNRKDDGRHRDRKSGREGRDRRTEHDHSQFDSRKDFICRVHNVPHLNIKGK